MHTWAPGLLILHHPPCTFSPPRCESRSSRVDQEVTRITDSLPPTMVGHDLARSMACYYEVPSWQSWFSGNAACSGNAGAIRRGSATCSDILPIVNSTGSSGLRTAGVLPLFIIAGMMKAGTTTLRKLLHNWHPQLQSGRGMVGQCEGEVHFFPQARIKSSKLFTACGGPPRDSMHLISNWCRIDTQHTNEVHNRWRPKAARILADTASGYAKYFPLQSSCESSQLQVRRGAMRLVFKFDDTPGMLITPKLKKTPKLHTMVSSSTLDGSLVLQWALRGRAAPVVILLRNPTSRYLSEMAWDYLSRGLCQHYMNTRLIDPWGKVGPPRLKNDSGARYDPGPHAPKLLKSGFHDRFGDPLRDETMSAFLLAPNTSQRGLLRSGYRHLLENLFSVYPREQVHLIKSERFFKAPVEVASELLARLGLVRLHVNTSAGKYTSTTKCSKLVLISNSSAYMMHAHLPRHGNTDLRDLTGEPDLFWEGPGM